MSKLSSYFLYVLLYCCSAAALFGSVVQKKEHVKLPPVSSHITRTREVVYKALQEHTPFPTVLCDLTLAYVGLKFFPRDSYKGSLINAICAISSTRIACGTVGGIIEIWNIENNQHVTNLEGYHKKITKIISLSHNRIASGYENEVVRIWELEKEVCEHIFTGHRSGIRSLVAIGEDLLGTVSVNGWIKIWNASTRALIRTLAMNGAIGLLPSGELLIGNRIGFVGRYDSLTGARNYEFNTNSKRRVSNIAVSPIGRIAIEFQCSSVAEIWAEKHDEHTSMTCPQFQFEIERSPAEFISALAWMQETLIAATSLGYMVFCDGSTGACLQEINICPAGDMVKSIAIPSPEQVVVNTLGHELIILDRGIDVEL